jgi:hypothetical protein
VATGSGSESVGPWLAGIASFDTARRSTARRPERERATTATGLARTTHLATCMFNFDTGDRALPWSIGAHFIIGGRISMADRP